MISKTPMKFERTGGVTLETTLQGWVQSPVNVQWSTKHEATALKDTFQFSSRPSLSNERDKLVIDSPDHQSHARSFEYITIPGKRCLQFQWRGSEVRNYSVYGHNESQLRHWNDRKYNFHLQTQY
ncbi:hypothetical protein M758_2G178000 [Ceratodon purpureus]|nr:hypothetical protein M758_2G178000 [Ceratodon purpureus]